MARSILSKKPTRRAICVITVIDFSCLIEGRRGCRHGQIRGLIVLWSIFLEWEGLGGKKCSPTVGFGPQGAPRNVPGFYVALVQIQLRNCLLGGVRCTRDSMSVPKEQYISWEYRISHHQTHYSPKGRDNIWHVRCNRQILCDYISTYRTDLPTLCTQEHQLYIWGYIPVMFGLTPNLRVSGAALYKFK